MEKNDIGLALSIVQMFSCKYEDRLKAEFVQLKFRRDKLKRLLECDDEMFSDGLPDRAILAKQLEVMEEYMNILDIRAVQEGISLVD